MGKVGLDLKKTNKAKRDQSIKIASVSLQYTAGDILLAFSLCNAIDIISGETLAVSHLDLLSVEV